MTQQHSALDNQTTHPKPQDLFFAFPEIMADSMEVMEYYYRGKIQVLEQSMAELTLLDNAREISLICKEIIRNKEILRRVCLKKQACS
jgi:hypothetical protein